LLFSSFLIFYLVFSINFSFLVVAHGFIVA